MAKIAISKSKPSDGIRAIANSLRELGNKVRFATPETNLTKYDLVINWGVGNGNGANALNKAPAVKLASNKLKSSNVLLEHNVPSVKYVSGQTYSQLRKAFPKATIIGRYTLTGSGGEGIVVFRKEDPPPEQEALAYSLYIKKNAEFRVHVLKDQVILITEKKRRVTGVESEPTKNELLIRNLGEHWVFCCDNLSCDARGDRQSLESVAINAVNALGLDFGGVDVIRDRATGEYVICEVNTMPGVGATETLNAYVNAFHSKAN